MFNSDLKADGPGANEFIKLKDGDSVIGALRGDEYIFYTHWVDGRTQLCKKAMGISQECPHCAAGERAKARFRFNMVVKQDDGDLKMKILDQSAGLFQELKTLHSEWDLSKTIIKISRTGSGVNDTSYSVVPTKQQIDEELEKKFSALDMHDLRHQDELEVAPAQDADVPF